MKTIHLHLEENQYKLLKHYKAKFDKIRKVTWIEYFLIMAKAMDYDSKMRKSSEDRSEQNGKVKHEDRGIRA